MTTPATTPCPTSMSQPSTQPVAVITTIDDIAQARTMARTLVEQRLAACVQISAIDSVYRWEGTVVEGQEWRLACKTREALLLPLQQAIRSLHSYTVPELHVERLHAVDADYAQWLLDETSTTAKPLNAGSASPGTV